MGIWLCTACAGTLGTSPDSCDPKLGYQLAAGYQASVVEESMLGVASFGLPWVDREVDPAEWA